MTEPLHPEQEPAPERDADDALASVMNVEADAESALADDPEPAADADGRDPEEVLRLDPSIEHREPAEDGPAAPRDQI